MDFMRDTLSDGRVFRTLNVVDDATRECLAFEIDTSLSGHRAAGGLDRIAEKRGRHPAPLVLYNGPECTSKALDARLMKLEFSRSPWDHTKGARHRREGVPRDGQLGHSNRLGQLIEGPMAPISAPRGLLGPRLRDLEALTRTVRDRNPSATAGSSASS